jgi:membrane-associated protease RseP (regulator of RpoE activity)
MQFRSSCRFDILATGLVAVLATGGWAQTGTPAAPIVKTEPPVARSGGYLGTYLGDVSDERAREFKLPESRGAFVGRVEAGSPADKAGLKENDVLLSFNEIKIQNRAHFHRLLLATPAGGKINLGISRNGSPLVLAVSPAERRQMAADGRSGLYSQVNALLDLAERSRQQAEELRQRGDEKGAAKMSEAEQGARKEAEAQRAFIDKELREGRIQTAPSLRPEWAVSVNRYQLGLSAIELSDQLAQYFDVPGQSLLLTEVRAGELAERAGLKAGDCIVAVNGEPVKTVADLTRIRADQQNKEVSELSLNVVRERVKQTIKLKLDAR